MLTASCAVAVGPCHGHSPRAPCPAFPWDARARANVVNVVTAQTERRSENERAGKEGRTHAHTAYAHLLCFAPVGALCAVFSWMSVHFVLFATSR